jgi:predicted phage terminase large subunit-like protein
MSELKFKLHPKQMEVLQSPARFKVVAAGRRGGKSYLARIMLLIAGMKEKNELGYNIKDKDVWYIAPTFQQGKDIQWNSLKEMGKDVIESAHENTATLRLVNGRRIQIKGSDRPDTLRGVGVSDVVLDEFAFMKPEVWDLIIRPTLADVEGNALFIGTPDGKNHFYDLWAEAASGAAGPDWEAFHFNSLDNPLLAKAEIEKARQRMSIEAFKQEFEASFSSAGSGAFKPSDIQYYDGSEPDEGWTYIAVDPAGYDEGNSLLKSQLKKLDECAIAVVKVAPSGWYVKDIISGRWGIREASLQIIRAAQKYQASCVGIEKGSLKNAIMPYLEDQMRRLSIYPRIEDLTHGGKKKQERIMWALQGRFQHGKIYLKKADWNRKFIEQLMDFPNPMVHDDLIDALSYIDQIATTVYDFNFESEDFKFLDAVSGY